MQEGPDGNDISMAENLRPVLKWAGGKRWIIPYLEPIWNEFRECRLVEPLCGGLAVSFGLRPSAALLNDVNPHLINFYKHVKRGLRPEIEMENDSDTFYRNRKRFNELILTGKWETSEAAQLFYYLNRTCYNGLCRFNSAGLFNVPFGRYGTIRYLRDFSAYANLLDKWDFSSRDFEEVEVVDGDFVYVDPPYDAEFTHYSSGGFTWGDQERVAEWASRLDVPVIISNQATGRIIDLYGSLGFSLKTVQVPRYINSYGKGRGAVQEVIGTMNI